MKQNTRQKFPDDSVINYSTVIRELSTIIFFREIISMGLYLGGLYLGAYNRGAYILGSYIGGL